MLSLIQIHYAVTCEIFSLGQNFTGHLLIMQECRKLLSCRETQSEGALLLVEVVDEEEGEGEGAASSTLHSGATPLHSPVSRQVLSISPAREGTREALRQEYETVSPTAYLPPNLLFSRSKEPAL